MGFKGFHISYYPGKSAMQKFWTGTPFRYAGFYLPSLQYVQTPAYTAQSRQEMYDIGYGFIVFYVGRQTGDSASLKTLTQGNIDGADAINQAKAVGFTTAVIFLDIEGDVTNDPKMQDYLLGFAGAFEGSRFACGVYCSAVSADFLRQVSANIFHWHIAKTSSSYTGNEPTDCGKDYANVWHYQKNVPQTYNEASLVVDLDVADSYDPSNGRSG
jgi:hypothetical protein